MANLINLARMTVTGAPGTGSVTLNAAVAGFITFANAGAVDGQTYTYAIREGNLREICRGVYTAATKVLTRITLRSTNATPTNPETFTSAAIVSGSLAAEDVSPSFRIRATANVDFYVRTDGSDSNNGLANTSGGAFLTVQHAVDIACGSYDFGPFTFAIHVGAGTFAEDVSTKPYLGANASIVGAGIASTTLAGQSATGAFTCQSAQHWTFDAMKVTSVTGLFCIYAVAAGSSITVMTIDCGAVAAGGSHIEASSGGFVVLSGNRTISAGAGAHLTAAFGGNIVDFSLVITITGTPAFTTAYAVGQFGGGMFISGVTYSGGATGPKFNASIQSWINASSLAGNANGTCDASSTVIVDGGVKRVKTQFDKTNSATLGNVTDLSVSVSSGITYLVRAKLFIDITNATPGFKVALAGPTMSLIVCQILGWSNAGTLVLTSRQTAIGGAGAGVVGPTSAYVTIEGTITPNAAGTLTVQAAQNTATAATTTSVLVGSTLEVTPVN